MNLLPRGATANQAQGGSAAAAASKPNPFGEARPREEVLASRGVAPAEKEKETVPAAPAAESDAAKPRQDERRSGAPARGGARPQQRDERPSEGRGANSRGQGMRGRAAANSGNRAANPAQPAKKDEDPEKKATNVFSALFLEDEDEQ